MMVILPQPTSSQIGLVSVAGRGPHPTLYLLHGQSDDDTIWLRRTSIERYVAPLGLAVVMPQVHRSFYTDMVQGGKYWTYISQEVPALARSFFPLSDIREDNFVAGLSMGGYGAFKLALSRPEQYAAAASLSGSLNVARAPAQSDELRRVFGEGDFSGTSNDLLWLLSRVDQSTGPVPQLYQCCGTEDFRYEDNLVFKARAEQTRVALTYDEGPGTHEWGYWDRKIQDVLAWLPLSRHT